MSTKKERDLARDRQRKLNAAVRGFDQNILSLRDLKREMAQDALEIDPMHKQAIDKIVASIVHVDACINQAIMAKVDFKVTMAQIRSNNMLLSALQAVANMDGGKNKSLAKDIKRARDALEKLMDKAQEESDATKDAFQEANPANMTSVSDEDRKRAFTYIESVREGQEIGLDSSLRSAIDAERNSN